MRVDELLWGAGAFLPVLDHATGHIVVLVAFSVEL